VARRTTARTGFSDRPNTRASGSTRARRAGELRQSESTTIEARRARPRETPRAVPDVRGRRTNLPVDVSPRRATEDRSRREAAPAREARPEPEARPARRSGDSPPPAIRSEPRSEPRTYDRGDRGSDRGGDGGRGVERAPSSPSGSSWSGGGGDYRGGGGGDRGGGGGDRGGGGGDRGGGGSPSSGGGRRR
jgi:hypothetical protein